MVLALVGVHNSCNAAESTHTSIARHALEELDQHTVRLSNDEFNDISNLASVKIGDVLRVSSQNSHEVFLCSSLRRRLCKIWLLIVVIVVLVVKVETSKMSSRSCLSKQGLLDALCLTDHLLLVCTYVLSSANFVGLLANATPLFGFFGLEIYCPLMTSSALQVKHWLALVILVEIKVSFVLISTLCHCIID